MKRTLLLLVASFGLLAAGCGSAGEKGKNKEKDVPKAPDVKKY